MSMYSRERICSALATFRKLFRETAAILWCVALPLLGLSTNVEERPVEKHHNCMCPFSDM
jgi:hypothetical protein